MAGQKIDPECVLLCRAINRIKGIQTIEACCGHGQRPYRIWFRPRSLKVLPQLLYWFDPCHCGFTGWRVVVYTDCAMSPAVFKIQGPKGPAAYTEAEHIAKLIQKDQAKGT